MAAEYTHLDGQVFRDHLTRDYGIDGKYFRQVAEAARPGRLAGVGP